MIHNENSRVKIPALVHLTRLGYRYIKQKDCSGAYCPKTNIFKGILRDSINRLNGTALTETDMDSLVEELAIKLNTDDLGRAFYKILLNGFNGLRLIDLEDEARNSYHVVTELTYQNGEDEFRPDITLLVNGLPLAFIEVKKPNNRDGIIAEHTRMNKRFAKKVFRRFANITQIMVFSNNMEYDDNDVEPIEGAFYASSSYEKLFFNRFREEDPTIHMIVCDSSPQAVKIEEELDKYPELTHELILCDVEDKETRRGYQEDFKKGKTDLLVVYNMLLTGFDAPRLKKQYLGRVIREHNLLQTLTRVNRPYKTFRYGYVVDFADIRNEFDKTNKAYFEELQSELGNEFEKYRNIFKSQEEIEQDLKSIQDKLFLYATDNAEHRRTDR